MSRTARSVTELTRDFLTERINEIDKISGLRLGAWDYLPKPISLEYLAERISSLLRINEARSALSKSESASEKNIGDLALDQDALLVSWKGQRIDLSGTEFRMLAKLVRLPSCGELRNAYECNHAIVGNEQHDQYAHAQHSEEIRGR